MKTTSLFLAASLAAVAQAASAADITGTVTLNGNPPAEREITPLENDATCGKLHTGKVMTQFYVVGSNKELADVIVMLKNVTGKSTGASAQPQLIDQKGCLYEPQILAIQTNQKLLVRNSDSSIPMHNVHINPTVDSNKPSDPTKLNAPQTAGAPDIEYTFPASENFMKFQCDVHPWMFAWVTVVDSPYFAKTGTDGKFTIKGVPPGKYTVTALHRKAAPAGVDKEVEVKDSGATVDFALDVK
jgi:hypothetical protein